jgi:hypothetical protein
MSIATQLIAILTDTLTEYSSQSEEDESEDIDNPQYQSPESSPSTSSSDSDVSTVGADSHEVCDSEDTS